MLKLRPASLLVACLLAVASTVNGQVKVQDKYEPFEPIIIGCVCDPVPLSELDIEWELDDKCKYETLDEGKRLHVWAPPGTHKASVRLTVFKFKEVQVFMPDPEAPADFTKAKLVTLKIPDGRVINKFSATFIVSGQAPQPPPVVVVPPIFPPEVPPVPTPVPPVPTPSGKRDLILIRESRLSSEKTAAIVRQLRDERNQSAKYLKDKGHSLLILDVDSLDEDDKPSKAVEAWRPVFKDMQLPVLVVTSKDATGATVLVGKTTLGPEASGEDVITILKSFGG